MREDSPGRTRPCYVAHNHGDPVFSVEKLSQRLGSGGRSEGFGHAWTTLAGRSGFQDSEQVFTGDPKLDRAVSILQGKEHSDSPRTSRPASARLIGVLINTVYPVHMFTQALTIRIRSSGDAAGVPEASFRAGGNQV